MAEEKTPIDPQDLIQRILVIMDKQICLIEKGKDPTLDYSTLKLLPDYLRIILSTQKNKVSEEKDFTKDIQIKSNEEIEELIRLERLKNK